MMTQFEIELKHLINRHSIENEVNMPDFILAAMICHMIAAIGPSIKRTLDWYGHHPAPVPETGGEEKGR